MYSFQSPTLLNSSRRVLVLFVYSRSWNTLLDCPVQDRHDVLPGSAGSESGKNCVEDRIGERTSRVLRFAGVFKAGKKE